ncbi:MAG: tyrosine--tRNA ligase [Chloroflexi bacterium]|nr:MAG: tyrosine--tRNA ligase [Chloroflexota bacterium]
MQSVDEFARGTEHLEDRDHLVARLARGDRLRIKWGVDPTAPDIHLGHTVPMRRLRAWQDSGHLPVIVIGDWTARIGDPSGRSETRPPLSAAEVDANAETYLAQLFSILDRARTEVRRQAEWFDGMGLAEVLRLCTTRTVQQLLQRTDFTERMAAEHAVGVHELMYPLLQGYDSVAVGADVELGGTDQLFNLLAARDVQRAYGQEPQDVVTVPLLEGTDGVRKMSKSYDNYIGIAEPPEAQFGKAMSIPDDLIVKYLTLVTDLPASRVDAVALAMQHGELNPRDAKALLATAIVRQFHGEDEARRADEEFTRVHRGGGLPDQVPVAEVEMREWDALELARRVQDASGEARSSSELRRLLAQGGIAIMAPSQHSWRQLRPDQPVPIVDGTVLRIGKHLYRRLVPPGAATGARVDS